MTNPDAPTRAGHRTHIVITITLDDLRSGIGTACRDLAGNISATDAHILAREARVIPVVLSSTPTANPRPRPHPALRHPS
jgi:hypothetical protein